MSIVAIVVAVVFLAFANGANDNFKGVATLFGSGAASYRTALIWATASALAGSFCALLLAQALVGTFKGKGLVPDAVATEGRFLLAASLAAAGTVFLATRIGMPVSTTHALIGGLLGAGIMAAANEIKIDALGRQFVLPLLLSPIVSLFLAAALYPLSRLARRIAGVSTETCVCIAGVRERVVVQSDGALKLVRTGAIVSIASMAECRTQYEGSVLGVQVDWALDGLHFLSSGAVCFARALNDTPKMLALMLAGEVVHPNFGIILVGVAMAVGGVVNGRWVAETMSRKITRMSPGQGLVANLVTALIVTTASPFGLPVSTTHVSVGSLFGIGLVNGTARRKTILSILVAWLTTLPVGIVFGVVGYVVLGAVGAKS